MYFAVLLDVPSGVAYLATFFKTDAEGFGGSGISCGGVGSFRLVRFDTAGRCVFPAGE